MKEATQGRRTELSIYLSTLDWKAGDALAQYNTWSTDPPTIVLSTKVDNLQRAGVFLTAFGRAER